MWNSLPLVESDCVALLFAWYQINLYLLSAKRQLHQRISQISPRPANRYGEMAELPPFQEGEFREFCSLGLVEFLLPALLRFGGKSHVLSLERSLVLSPHLDERVIAARSACSHSSTDKPYARASV
jgi:hypothetical protein